MRPSFVLAAALLGAALSPALAADPAAATRGAAAVAVAACDDPGVLARVQRRFAYGAARVEGRTLAIAAFDRIRDEGAAASPSPIPQRWCSAAVTLSDATRTTAWWRIERGTGFAAPGLAFLPDGLELCVAGHDPWRVHDGSCRTTRRWW